MVRNYKRKTTRGNRNSREKLQEASKLIDEQNFSLRLAAKSADVDKSALSRYRNSKRVGYHAARQVFSAEMEQQLTDYLVTCARMNHGLTMEEARRFAYEYATAKHVEIPQSWNVNGMAGIDWAHKFTQRNQQLSLRKPEATSLARSTAFNKHTVGKFFTNLESIHKKNNFPPNRIFNVDETGLTTVHVPPKVLAPKNMKQVGQVTSGERGILVTLACCVSADGNSILPAFIWPRKTERNIESYMVNAPAGSQGLVHESGWMTAANFNKWMTHFIHFSKPTKEAPVLLLLDNHHSHLSYEAVEMAKENNVVLLTFPPHVTNRLQPLDVSVYGPLKKYYSSACNGWMMDNPGKTITLYQISGLAAKSLLRAQTPENIVSGFRATGIFSYDAEIFSEADFMPAAITDRPAPVVGDTEPSTSAVSLQVPADSNSVTPESIRPFPKAKPRTQQRSRKRGQTLVLTDTPVKDNIQREAMARARKSQKVRREQILTTDSDSSDDEPVPVDDSSSCASEDDESVERDAIVEGAYVVVEYSTKKMKKYFVGKVMSPPQDDRVDVDFLKRCGAGFVRPQPQDIDSVEVTSIRLVLPPPHPCAGTSRVQDKLLFHVELDMVKE